MSFQRYVLTGSSEGADKASDVFALDAGVRGIELVLTLTAIQSGAPTFTLRLERYNELVPDLFWEVASHSVAASVVNHRRVLLVHPDAQAAYADSDTEVAKVPMPPNYRLKVIYGGTGTGSYAVTASGLP